ncbi:hypothetical protein FQR65_LT18045 [Abscondita terminalis]|nr:hypothetical protein FQR65_LT18045 [Abscondita terminalis]
MGRLHYDFSGEHVLLRARVAASAGGGGGFAAAGADVTILAGNADIHETARAIGACCKRALARLGRIGRTHQNNAGLERITPPASDPDNAVEYTSAHHDINTTPFTLHAMPSRIWWRADASSSRRQSWSRVAVPGFPPYHL